MKFEGIYPPIITPHKNDGSIDRNGFATVIDHLITKGVHGIITSGTTGEYYAQTFDERVALMKLANEFINGRLPLIVGVSAIRTEDSCALAVAARDHGADALLVSASPYALPTQQELSKHVLGIDRAAGLPIILYNYPARTGTMMEVEFLDLVCRNKNIRAIKESSGDINRLHMLACDYPHLDLLCGMDDQALEFFAWGARGWVCAAGNCLPLEHLVLYQAVVLENNAQKGRRIMSALLPFMAVLEQGGKFIQSIKYACSLEGLPAGPVRKPLGELNESEKEDIKKIVEDLKKKVSNIMRGEGPSLNE